MVESPLCVFYNEEEKSLEHLLYFCKSSTFFWKELLSWLADLDILFGKFDLDKDFFLVNHIILLAKYFIYKCKFSKASPSLTVFKAKLKATHKLELYIAKKSGILINHYKTWDHLLSLIIIIIIIIYNNNNKVCLSLYFPGFSLSFKVDG